MAPKLSYNPSSSTVLTERNTRLQESQFPLWVLVLPDGIRCLGVSLSLRSVPVGKKYSKIIESSPRCAPRKCGKRLKRTVDETGGFVLDLHWLSRLESKGRALSKSKPRFYPCCWRDLCSYCHKTCGWSSGFTEAEQRKLVKLWQFCNLPMAVGRGKSRTDLSKVGQVCFSF